MKHALEKACAAAGSPSNLAERIGVSPQTVFNWLARRIPAEKVLDVEYAIDGAVTRYELRPDVFGPAPEQTAA